MKYSWFYHHECTTEQADQLVAHYTARGIKTERSLSPDFVTWTVSALLPECRRPERTPRALVPRVWG